MVASPCRIIVIVGGVAGGASCAARLRRMDENAEIIILERGPFAAFANCGLSGGYTTFRHVTGATPG